MSDDLLDLLDGIDPEAVFLIVAMGLLRPLGLLFGFIAFSWGFGNSTVLRASVAFALGLPLMVGHLDLTTRIAATASRFDLAVLAPKEFVVGYGLGLLASLPFLALQYAGAVTDGYRGESDSGMQDPAGGSLQTFSVLYLVIGFVAFVSMGGLWELTNMLYDSFTVWPVDRLYPGLAPGAGAAALAIVDSTLYQAVLVAAPLLILLMAVELLLVVAAKLGRRFGMYDLVFLSKNVVAILSLPMLALLVLRMAEALVPAAMEALPLLQRLMP